MEHSIPDKHCLWVNLPVPSRLVGQSNHFAQSLLTLGVHSLVEVVFDKIYCRHGDIQLGMVMPSSETEMMRNG